MIAFDTNVLVRYLTRDDARQVATVRALLEEALANGHPVLLPRTALVETVWVLRSAFRIRKPEIVNLLSELLNAPPFMVAEEDLIRTALAR